MLRFQFHYSFVSAAADGRCLAPLSVMKVKVLFRDEDVMEAVVDFDRLPAAGDLVHVPGVGKVKVVSTLRASVRTEYEAYAVVIRARA